MQCPYAKGHFDRVNEAAFDLIHDCEQITREKLTACAEKYKVCPFELSLDVSYWVDAKYVIIIMFLSLMCACSVILQTVKEASTYF